MNWRSAERVLMKLEDEIVFIFMRNRDSSTTTNSRHSFQIIYFCFLRFGFSPSVCHNIECKRRTLLAITIHHKHTHTICTKWNWKHQSGWWQSGIRTNKLKIYLFRKQFRMPQDSSFQCVCRRCYVLVYRGWDNGNGDDDNNISEDAPLEKRRKNHFLFCWLFHLVWDNGFADAGTTQTRLQWQTVEAEDTRKWFDWCNVSYWSMSSNISTIYYSK